MLAYQDALDSVGLKDVRIRRVGDLPSVRVALVLCGVL